MPYTDAELDAIYDQHSQSQPVATSQPMTSGYSDADLDAIYDQFNSQPQAQPEQTANQQISGLDYLAGMARKPLQGASFGFLDEASAGVNSVLDTGITGVRKLFNPDVQDAETYDQWLNKTRAIDKETKNISPLISTGLEMTGAIASPVSKLGAGIGGIKGLATAGALQGGIYGFGEGEGGFQNRAINAGKSGALGAGVGTTLGLLGKGIVSAKNAIQNTVKPMTAKGRDEIARNILLKADPELASKLDAGLQNADEFLKFKNTAEVANSPALSRLEQGLSSANPEFDKLLTEKIASRNLARTDLLDSVAPLSQTPDDLFGAGIKDTIKSGFKKEKSNLSKLYESIDPENTSKIDISNLQSDSVASLNKYFGEGAGKAPSELSSLTKDLLEGDVTKSYKFLQNARSRASELGKKYAISGDNRASSVAKSIADSIDNTITNSSKAQTGLSATDASNWLTAKTGYADMMSKYKTGAVKKVTSAKAELADSSVLAQIMKSPENAESFIKALGKDAQEIADIRSQALTDIIKKSTSNNDGVLLNASFNKNIQKKSDVLRKLFDDNHIKNIQKVADDLRSQETIRSLGRQGSKGGSNTFDKFSTANYVKESILQELGIVGKLANSKIANMGVLGGSVYTGGLTGAGLASTGAGIKSGYSKVIGQVDELLLKATSDPEFARILVAKPTQESVSKVKELIAPQIQKLITSSSATTGSKVFLPATALAEKPTRTLLPEQPREPIQLPELQSESEWTDYTPDFGNQENASFMPSSYADLVPENVHQALLKTESNFNPNAVSSKGARGIGQIMPATGREILTELLGREPSDIELEEALNDPELNSMMSKHYLGKQLATFNGDLDLALAAYNAGAGAVKKYGGIPPYKETQDYVAKIKKLIA